MPSFRAKRPRRQDRPMPSYVNKPFSFPYGTSPFGALPSPTSQAQRQFHYPPYFGGPSSSMPMTRFPMAFTRGAMLQVPQPSNLNPSSSPNVLSGGLHTSQPISPRPPFPFVTPASTIGNAGVPPNLSSSTNTVPQQQRVQNFSEGHLQNLTWQIIHYLFVTQMSYVFHVMLNAPKKRQYTCTDVSVSPVCGTWTTTKVLVQVVQIQLWIPTNQRWKEIMFCIPCMKNTLQCGA